MANTLQVSSLPVGDSPQPLTPAHFPSRLHAFVWRNWQLVPAERMANVAGCTADDIIGVGRRMGLSGPPDITSEQQQRSTITVIRRNWHLLPYEQLLQLLEWSADRMDFALREDDFLWGKLGGRKPACEPIVYQELDDECLRREQEIAAVVQAELPDGAGTLHEPLFDFVGRLSRMPEYSGTVTEAPQTRFQPNFCSSYFALYGDPLLDQATDPYPEGYLAQLQQCGVNGIWLQAVLYKLTPFPWQPEISERYEERLANLRVLIERARRFGMGVYLYLNEPRCMPLSFFEEHPDLKGVEEHQFAALCTSHPEVKNYLRESVAFLCREVPEIAGFFTITSSENFTHCWSHTVSNCYGTNSGHHCPRCSARSGPEVIAEVNTLFWEGIQQAGSDAELFVWDWAWSNHTHTSDNNNWAEAIIPLLPPQAAFISVSEWCMPINPGGVEGAIGEYALSVIGPGPRALAHWGLARRHGLGIVAKIQANNTWELSAVPYIPAVYNVARHTANLCAHGVDGLMLGWTLGGYPSPNLDVVAELGRVANTAQEQTPEAMAQSAMHAVAQRRFGAAGTLVVNAWTQFSVAFQEFPFHTATVYLAPMNYGPSNLLWENPTGYHATMIGFPYDDLKSWRAEYPAEIFLEQFQKLVRGWEDGFGVLRHARAAAEPAYVEALDAELRIAEAAQCHWRTTANQIEFVIARNALEKSIGTNDVAQWIEVIERVLFDEIEQARRLHDIQVRDSRIGFESSNQYFYVPCDLAEKVLNCRDLLDRWLPSYRTRL